MRSLGVGAAIGAIAVGAALEFGIGKGIQKASELQSALKSLQVTTGVSNPTLDRIHDLALSVTGATSQSIQQILSEFQSGVRGGLTPGQLMGNNGALFRKMAYFSDVLYRTPGLGTDPNESMYDIAKISHMLGAYSPKAMGDVTEDIYAAMRTGPFELDKMVTQGKYFMSLFHNLGASNKDIIAMTSFMGQLGYMQGRGGTGMQAIALGLINAAQMTTSRQAKQKNALKDLGLIGPNGQSLYMSHERQADGTYKNHWDVMGMMSHLVSFAKYHPAVTFAGLINSALGRIAVPLVSAASMGQAYEQFLKIYAEQQKLKREMPIEKAQQELVYGTFKGASGLLKTNIESAIAEIFLPLTNTLIPYITKLASVFLQIAIFARQHPAAMLTATLTAAATGLVLIVGGAAALARMSWVAYAGLRALSRMEGEQTVASAAAGGGGLLGKLFGGLAIGGWLKNAFSGVGKYLLGEGFVANAGFGGHMIYKAGAIAEGLGGNLESNMAIRGFIMRVLPLIGAAFSRVGASLIPLVGEVFMFITAIQLLKGHATNVGWVLGTMARWITHSFWPGVLWAFSAGFTNSKGSLSKMFTGNVTDWFRDAIDAYEAALHGESLHHYRLKKYGPQGRKPGADELTLAMEGKGPWAFDNLVLKPLGVKLGQFGNFMKQCFYTATNFVEQQLRRFDSWNRSIWQSIINTITQSILKIPALFSALSANIAAKIHSIPFIGDKLVPNAPSGAAHPHATVRRVSATHPHAPVRVGDITIHVNGAGNPKQVADAVMNLLVKHGGLQQRAQGGQATSPFSIESQLGLVGVPG